MRFLLFVLLTNYYIIIFLLFIYLQIIFKILINLNFFDIVNLLNSLFVFCYLYMIIIIINF
jgi:hypothetical protein